MSEGVQFNNISLLSKGKLFKGMVKMQEAGVAFKNQATGAVTLAASSDLRGFAWHRAATGYELAIQLPSSKLRLLGFKEAHLTDIEQYVSSTFHQTVQTSDIATKGWTWGEPRFTGNGLAFYVDGKVAFELPLSDVSQTHMKKNDITLEFKQDDPNDDDQQLVNMRFVVHPSAVLESEDPVEKARREEERKKRERIERDKRNAARARRNDLRRRRREAEQSTIMQVDGEEPAPTQVSSDEEDSASEPEEAEEGVEGDEHELPVTRLFQRILGKVDVAHTAGDVIVSLLDVNCQTPRGRYQMDFYPTMLTLHGQTHDFKIPFASISKTFVLPHPDQFRVFVVLALDPPVRQGQTPYPFIVFLLQTEGREISVELNMTEAEIAEKNLQVSKLINKNVREGDAPKPNHFAITKEMSGGEVMILARLLSAMSVRLPIQPAAASSKDKAYSEQHGYKASYRASDGYLFPLENAFIFVHKPLTYIHYSDIKTVTFERGSSILKTFAFTIVTHSGTGFTFNSIPKEEQRNLEQFCNAKARSKGFSVVADKPPARGAAAAAGDDSDDEDGAIHSDDEENDSYKRRMKKEGHAREIAGDDYDSEEDEDFQANSDVEEVGEEFDENYTSSSDDSGSDSSDSGSGSEDENGEPKVKKAKKHKKEHKPKPVRKAPKKSSSPTKKAAKDKNAPKKPMSSYMLWANENRAAFKAKNPDANVMELGSILGNAWKELGESEKNSWAEKATEARKAYEITLAEYEQKKKERAAAGEPMDVDEEPAKPKKKAAASTSSSSSKKFKSEEFIEDSD
ncbi:structure-specific recognition protein 1 [Capsaspora owczarzaki ATCC 30864]|uniref:structure-specific recognition protein 1 n=1 Tax=Capsaspora owczarzaki (strain ATCC 30864) TaxID=595528 RepID=UPI000352685A|nr:structure-specific recognition protein 1 [Capsaspora owczarzaki ATCC 30864]|eukprot:XP_004343431.2 structure-specific recognition protein 1 [Capsaspora owczarzaki ATCC 30864]